MKFAAVFIISIILIGFLSQVEARQNVAQLLKVEESNPTSVESKEVEFNIIVCFKTIYSLIQWGYGFYRAIMDEDFAALITLLTQIQTLVSTFISSCL